MTWPEITYDCDMNEVPKNWTDTLKCVVHNHTPCKTITIKGKNKKWFNKDIKRLMRKRDSEYSKAKKTRKPKTDKVWDNWKQLSQEVKDECEIAKKKELDKLTNRINQGAGNEKDWWNLVSSLYKNQTDSSDHPLLVEGKWIDDMKEKAEILNQHFATISRVDDPDGPLPEEEVYNDNIPTIDTVNITEEKVKNAIKQSKRRSAAGQDGLSNDVLKRCSDNIVPFLTKYFQACMDKQLMPPEWKKANVVPVHKGGAKEDVANYRPISLLSCTSKLLERVICDDLNIFLEENNIIGPNQFGFVRGSSTIDQLMELYHRVITSMDNQLLMKVIFLDVSKAFDRVWRKGLIHKMRKLGIRGRLLGWFASYLEERMQRVVLKGTVSAWSTIMAGVPQGSILGPILYLLFAEDLCELIMCGLRMFADDTLLFAEGLTERECAKAIQPSLDALNKWAKKWKIKLNSSKTKTLTFSRVGSLKYPLTMDYRFVEEVLIHKHLGLTLSYDGRWSEHLTVISRKVTKRLCILRRYTKKINRKSLQMIFNSYILPIMEYGNIAMANMNCGDCERLEELHRCAIRCVTGCKLGTSHLALYKELDVQPLEHRRRVVRLTKFYQIREDIREYRLGANDITQTITRNPRATRRPFDYIPLRCHTEAKHQSFLAKTIREWNDLPDSIKSVQSVGAFKQKIRHKPSPNPIYYVELNRRASIELTRLRCGNGNLAVNLYERALMDSPLCQCGERETDYIILKTAQSTKMPGRQLKMRYPTYSGIRP